MINLRPSILRWQRRAVEPRPTEFSASTGSVEFGRGHCITIFYKSCVTPFTKWRSGGGGRGDEGWNGGWEDRFRSQKKAVNQSSGGRGSWAVPHYIHIHRVIRIRPKGLSKSEDRNWTWEALISSVWYYFTSFIIRLHERPRVYRRGLPREY